MCIGLREHVPDPRHHAHQRFHLPLHRFCLKRNLWHDQDSQGDITVGQLHCTNTPDLPALPLLNGHLDDQVVLDVLQTHAGHARQLNVHLDVCAQVGGAAI